MQNAARDVPAWGDGVAQSVDGKLGRHSLADGVADDLVREHVLDCAAIELALRRRAVLGDVGQL